MERFLDALGGRCSILWDIDINTIDLSFDARSGPQAYGRGSRTKREGTPPLPSLVNITPLQLLVSMSRRQKCIYKMRKNKNKNKFQISTKFKHAPGM